MRRRSLCVLSVVLLGLMLSLGGAVVLVPTASAEEAVLDLNSPDAVKHALEQQVGKRVKVKLESGQDLEGKVAKVGSHAVQLSELTGMEFFDATVKLEEIVAVIVRVRMK
jgi:primosomal protein N'